MVSAAANNRKLKILCLHGYEQDADIFRTKLRLHMASLCEKADFVFVTAPNTLSPYDIDGVDNMTRAAAAKAGETTPRELRGWFALKSTSPEAVHGLEDSIAFLESVLTKQGPFDGGLMAALMTTLLEHRHIGLSSDCMHPPFKFAVVSSGYMLKDNAWAHVYQKPISTPSLHMYGVLDSMIGISRSMELQSVFILPSEYCYVGAHYVPKSQDALDSVCEFISQFSI
ncbi:hypothetical protein EV174_000117 [Coemansia sp. RSA 2320]|nr:hypothetical protein EV174_000117 [Coemansia sp. RSA 2320]